MLPASTSVHCAVPPPPATAFSEALSETLDRCKWRLADRQKFYCTLVRSRSSLVASVESIKYELFAQLKLMTTKTECSELLVLSTLAWLSSTSTTTQKMLRWSVFALSSRGVGIRILSRTSTTLSFVVVFTDSSV